MRCRVCREISQRAAFFVPIARAGWRVIREGRKHTCRGTMGSDGDHSPTPAVENGYVASHS